MVTIHNQARNGLKGIIYYKDEPIGVCESAETFLDFLCQVKAEESDDYKMEVEVNVTEDSKRTYVYRITKYGTTIPSSYPGVFLWTDLINKKLLYLYNFSISHDFKMKQNI